MANHGSSPALEYLQQRVNQGQAELVKLEKKLYEAEGEYLACESSQMGTVIKGYDGFLSSKDNMRKRQRTLKLEDRLFSLSSRSSPAAKEEERMLESENQSAKHAQDGGGGMQRSRSRSSQFTQKRMRSSKSGDFRSPRASDAKAST